MVILYLEILVFQTVLGTIIDTKQDHVLFRTDMEDNLGMDILGVHVMLNLVTLDIIFLEGLV
jgi:hypothetical protein